MTKKYDRKQLGRLIKAAERLEQANDRLLLVLAQWQKRKANLQTLNKAKADVINARERLRKLWGEDGPDDFLTPERLVELGKICSRIEHPVEERWW